MPEADSRWQCDYCNREFVNAPPGKILEYPDDRETIQVYLCEGCK